MRTLANLWRVFADVVSFGITTRRPGLMLVLLAALSLALVVVGVQIVAPVAVYPFL